MFRKENCMEKKRGKAICVSGFNKIDEIEKLNLKLKLSDIL